MKKKISNDVIHKEVIIIGNGPSGISLSYMLSGYLPYLTSYTHPDEMLSLRLKPHVGKCLIELDLKELAGDLEGRSKNPISLLLDSLLHPYADMGYELEPLVEFRKTGVEIEHLVLGKGPPGGSWHKMDPHILTLSLGSWMSLPGLPFQSRDTSEKRAYACNVANYYIKYVRKMNLEKNFLNGVHVKKVTNIENNNNQKNSKKSNNNNNNNNCIISNAFNYIFRNSQKTNRCCKRPREQLNDQDQSPERKVSLVREQDSFNNSQLKQYNNYCDLLCDRNNINNTFNMSCSSSNMLEQVPYQCDSDKNWLIEAYDEDTGVVNKFTCKYLILANGANDIPNKLEISQYKKDPDWMFYDLRSLEIHLDQYMYGNNDNEPVLVIGGGLSAADAVIALRGRNIPVIHVFRNRLADWNKQLPENMYPEYHKVRQMMLDGGSTYPLYTAYPEYNLTNIDENNRTVTLTSRTGVDEIKLSISFCVILIGSRADLDFFPIKNLGIKKELPIDCKSNTINIDRFTHQVIDINNLYAIGPLVGDNFVRFIPGGALAVVKHLYDKNGYY